MKENTEDLLSAEDSLSEAYSRVEYAKAHGDRSLNFSDLRNLDRIPETISELGHIERLNISNTKITELGPVKNCENITFVDAEHSLLIDISALEGKSDLFTFNADYTPLTDISALASAKGLYSLSLTGTPIVDISVVGNLRNLNHLSIDKTSVSDISPLVNNKHLTMLDLANTSVSSLSSIRNATKLISLDIRGTKVSDLSPIAQLSNLFSLGGASGIDIRGAFNLPAELQALADLPAPVRSMRINAALSGGAPTDIEIDLLQDASEANLAQRPAAFIFSLKDGIINSSAYHEATANHRVSDDIRSIVVEKVDFAISLLTGNEHNAQLSRTLGGLRDELDGPAEALRDGIILMRFRTLEACAASYETAESGHSEQLRAAIIDVASSLEDFLATLPGISQIDAGRQALQMQSEPQNIKILQDQIVKIADISRNSGAVSEDALGAILEGTREVSLLDEVIRATPNEAVRAKAIQRQASLAGLQALNIRNYAAAPIRFLLKEIGPVASDSWKAAKVAVPKGVGTGVEGLVSGGIRSAPALLVASLAGPLSGLIVLAATFAPLARLAAKVSNEVESNSED